jgi:hypothetical protein
MQLRHFLTIFLILTISTLFSQNNKRLKMVEGIVMFYIHEIHNSVPEDIVFIPYNIDRTKSLKENAKICFEANTIGYFMYFQNMRHTQPFVSMRLSELNDIDSTKYLIAKSLRQSCEMMQVDTLSTDNFPTTMPDNISSCQIAISCGAIIFDESLIEGYKKDKDLSYNESLLPCQIDIDNKKVEFKYHQYYYNHLIFGMSLSFLPILLNK